MTAYLYSHSRPILPIQSHHSSNISISRTSRGPVRVSSVPRFHLCPARGRGRQRNQTWAVHVDHIVYGNDAEDYPRQRTDRKSMYNNFMPVLARARGTQQRRNNYTRSIRRYLQTAGGALTLKIFSRGGGGGWPLGERYIVLFWLVSPPRLIPIFLF